MRKHLEISLCCFILTCIIAGSFYYTSQQNPISYCNNETSCVIELVKETNQAELCKTSTNKSFCYQTSSIFLENSSLCKLSNQNTTCYYEFIYTYNSPDLCQDTQNPDSCLYSYILHFENANLCENHSQKEKCYYSYALAKNTNTTCNLTGNLSQVCFTKTNHHRYYDRSDLNESQ